MKLDYIGLSQDGRTNRWRVTCDCGNTFSPQTSLMAKQTVICPKCSANMFCDYNDGTIKAAHNIWIGCHADKSIREE